MDPLWLLRGEYKTPGWKELETDARTGKTDVLIFDRDAWALVRGAEAPQYEGFAVSEPKDGMYVDHQGRYVYLVDRQEVRSAIEVVRALGEEAGELLDEIGDPDTVLQRVGRAF